MTAAKGALSTPLQAPHPRRKSCPSLPVLSTPCRPLIKERSPAPHSPSSPHPAGPSSKREVLSLTPRPLHTLPAPHQRGKSFHSLPVLSTPCRPLIKERSPVAHSPSSPHPAGPSSKRKVLSLTPRPLHTLSAPHQREKSCP